MARILSLCTYPVSVPRHGGQARVNAIQQLYRAAGHEVRHLAAYRADEYPEEAESSWNIHFTWPFINELLSTGGRTDINASDFILRDPSVRERVHNLIDGFEPDVLQLEHCWMWPLIKMLKASSRRIRSMRVVYSSQNVEYLLIGNSTRSGAHAISEDTVALVRQMEMDLVENADLVVTVSDADAKYLQTTAKPAIVAPNGIWPREPASGQDYWDKEIQNRRFALFVGSAHPPNAAGFIKLLGPSLGFLPPNQMIVVVGGVCNLLRADDRFRENIGLNLARSMLVGVQDAGGLSTFIERAYVVIVPITEGGGTNIKMAEALYNRKLVICTSKAMRGYEAFLNMPFVLVRETPDAFQATLAQALRGEFDTRLMLKHSEVERLKALLWSSTLAELPDKINTLMA